MQKIIDIPKVQEQIKDLNKVKTRQMSLKQKKLKFFFMELLMLPDKFNSYFSENCWIAFDFFDEKTMNEAISIYKKNKCMEEVDNYLSNQYNEESINQFINTILPFKNLYLENLPNIGTLFYKYFLDRIDIIQIAKDDYINEKYYSCIPLLLSVIDGITNDIDHEFGFFNGWANMILEDSIVGHETGLQVIKNIVIQSRKTTNLEQITIPYRNGILHGRDLNYGNKIVASKCWNILFALKYWAIDNNRKDFIVENREPITKENIDIFVDKNYNNFLADLFEKLKHGNKKHELIYFGKYPSNIYSKYHRMEELGRLFKGINFLNFEVIQQEYYRENLKSLSIDITYVFSEKELKKQVNILLEYSDMDNKIVSVKNKNGHWKLDFLSTFNLLRD